jgi:hypothetical protein
VDTEDRLRTFGPNLLLEEQGTHPVALLIGQFSVAADGSG